MQYYLLKKNLTDNGIPIKINSKIQKICNKMAKLINQHAVLDRQLVKELADLNGISENEASDIMCWYDFLVDVSQYGLSNISNEQISRRYYLAVKRRQRKDGE